MTNEDRICENLARVQGQIAAAAQRSGRTADDVNLVAVTKYVGIEEIRALLAAGCREIGESRPQELWSKAQALSAEPVHWHLIGHLQRNKVRHTLPLVSLVHSVDSERLLRSINSECDRIDKQVEVLLEVNVSGEPAKHGFAPDDLNEVLPRLDYMNRVEVRGLMAMAGLGGGLDGARRDFALLRELREQLIKHCRSNVTLVELSMGMSGDFEVAVEEGATMVRVGSALFEGVA